MNKKIIPNFIVLLTTILILLLLLEVTFRLTSSYSDQFLCNTFSDLNDRFLCAMEKPLRSSIEENLSISTTDKDICDVWDSDLGWAPRNNCKAGTYTTNSQGFRGTLDVLSKKTKPRIVMLGDSFTWGEKNLDNQTYPFYLEQLFGGSVEVVNMGVHGYGPDQFYLYYLREGQKLNPDVVIFGLFLPDIHRTVFHIREFYKPRFTIINNTLVKHPLSSIPSLDEALSSSSKIKHKPRFYLFSYVYGFYSKATRLFTHYEDEVALTLKIIGETNAAMSEKNISFIVILIPEQGMVEKNNEDYHGTIPILEQELQRKSIQYLNLNPSFKQEFEQSGKSFYQGHLTSEGNMLIARELYGLQPITDLQIRVSTKQQ